MSLLLRGAITLFLVAGVTAGAGYLARALMYAPEHQALDAGVAARLDGQVQSMLQVQLAAGAVAAVLGLLFFYRSLSSKVSRLTEHVQDLRFDEGSLPDSGVRGKSGVGLLGAEVDQLVHRAEEGIRAREAQLKHLRETEERQEATLRATGDGLWDWNVNGDKVYFCPKLRAMLGEKKKGATLNRTEWIAFIHPEDLEDFTVALKAFVSGETPTLHIEHRLQRKEGDYIWTLCRGSLLRSPTGAVRRVVGIVTDITAQKEREAQLAHEAMHDVLTGLANRAMLVQQLNQALGRAKRKNHKFGLLFMDLDRFKVVNDGLGHMVGDELLKGVAHRIQMSVRSTDTVGRCASTVARLGGDEFVVLLDDIYDVLDAIRVAERVQKNIMEPFSIPGHEVFTSTSIGIAMGDVSTESGDELLRNADTALYRAKAQGRACYAVFDVEMGKRAKKRVRLENDLRRAIEREELALHFQPIIDLKTGRIASFEVLVRWNHPEFGQVPPDEFVVIAEETDTIQQMGRWLLRTAARQTRAWQERFPHARDLDVNVNFSSKEFLHPNAVEAITEDLREAGLAPEHLRIEVTEAVLMKNAKEVLKRLTTFRELGIQMAIDDFGTGASSLTHLTRFPVHMVKIDLSFVREMHASPESLQLVRSIIALSQSLNLKVIAEGVEEEHQLERLKGLGCEMSQGYLFSKPLDVQAATRLLESDPGW